MISPAPRPKEQQPLLAWLPLTLACVLEMVWIVAPWRSVISFFSLLGCIFLVGLSLIVGIVLLIKGNHPRTAIGVLLGTVFLLPFLTWVLLDVLKLHLYLHGQ